MEAKYTQGNINSLSGIGDAVRLFQISAAVQPGNSGGPLLDGEGQVVGHTQPDGLGWYIMAFGGRGMGRADHRGVN